MARDIILLRGLILADDQITLEGLRGGDLFPASGAASARRSFPCHRRAYAAPLAFGPFPSLGGFVLPAG
jgi:hypothetical protein